METHNLLSSRQSDYRAHRSTETAVIDVHNRVVRNVDRGGHVSVLVLLDRRSTFDTVDHAILLEVLAKYFGVARIALDWFRSYLDGRTQTLYVTAQQSATFVVHCSVPKGSVLGALKFICYTKDLPAMIANMRSTTVCTPTTLNYRMTSRLYLSRPQSRTSKNVSKRCTFGARPSGSS